ncbi:MAG: hypothetical protein IPQ02_05735 [Saprospiraceae bacterium]|nr:hypothetical protein [Candidatus Defluviibacterium haderslevense]
MKAWKGVHKKDNYPILLLVGILFFCSSIYITIHYVPQFETRIGFVPYDPFMALLPAIDVSFWVFFILYGAIVFGAYYFIQHPKLFLMILFSFGFMYWFRAICITFVPLNEPTLLIPLKDPLIEKLGIYQQFIKKDLFFSGHFASIFIPWLVIRKQQVRWVFLLCSIAIGLLVMIQHIHYSFDIFGAIVFSYLAVYCATKILERFIPEG